DRRVDLGLGREAAQGEPHRAADRLLAAPERAEHVARLEPGARALRAPRPALDAREAQVRRVGEAAFGMAVRPHAVQPLAEPRLEPVAQRAEAGLLRGHLLPARLRGGAETHDRRDVQRPGPEAAL